MPLTKRLATTRQRKHAFLGAGTTAVTRHNSYSHQRRRSLHRPPIRPKGYSDEKWLAAVADTERLGYPPREAAQ